MIGETSLMMGFTFIVGMAFAYVLKLMTFFFSRLNGTEISALLRKGRIWGRAYRMDIARTDRYIRSVARIGGDVSADPDADHAMDALADSPDKARNMGLHGRARLSEKYALSKHMDTLQALYKELLSRP